MSIRHKAIVAPLDKGHSSEWNDDHILDFTDEIEPYCLLRAISLYASWDFAQTAGGYEPEVQMVGAAGSGHAFIVFNTGGVTGQTSSMRKELAGAVSNITSPDDNPLLTFALQIVRVHTEGKVIECGFFNSGDSIFTANQNGAYFRIEDNKVYAVTGNGTAETKTEIGPYNEYGQYRIVFGTGKVDFYIDDMATKKASHTTTLPDSDLTLKFSIQSQDDVDSTMRIDAIGMTILRKK